MKKVASQLKKTVSTTLLIGACLTFMATSTVWAGTPETNPAANSVTPPVASIQSVDGYESDALRQKHKEVDQLIFEKYKGEFTDKGFKVTQTGPVNGKVEIGITPYDQQKADYLYNLLGSDLVQVVEGTQAVPLSAAAAPATTTAKQDAKPVYQTISAPAPDIADAASGRNQTGMLVASVITAFMLLGGGAFVWRKVTASKKS